MEINILACGIFKPELEKILPDIERELNKNIKVTFLSPGLHIDYNKMECELKKELELTKKQKTLLLYGSMCHIKLPEIIKNYNIINPNEKNCIELILSAERKKEIDKSGNVFYLTCGWLRYWREIFQQGLEAIICDKIVLLDTESDLISDEEMLEFFDYIHIPIEIEKITLEHFKKTLINICKNIY
jgi:hypothetical protein